MIIKLLKVLEQNFSKYKIVMITVERKMFLYYQIEYLVEILYINKKDINIYCALKQNKDIILI